MKIKFLPFALLLAGTASAQTTIVKLDIFQPIVNTAAISFEHVLNETSSFQVTVAGTFGYKQSDFGFNSQVQEPRTSGIAITPEYRYYLSEKHAAPQGFYAAPFVRYQYLSQSGSYYTANGYYQAYEASLNAFGFGLTVGRHWIFKRHFSLDIFAGPGYTFAGISSDQASYTPSRSDFLGYYDGNYDLRGGVTFGIAF